MTPVLERLWQESPELLWALAVFAIALPLELWRGVGPRPAWSERLGNLGAMLLHFFLGGGVLILLLLSPLRQLLPSVSPTPRFELLVHPVSWALVFVFLLDGLYYAYHRLQHGLRWFWRIHALHHTDPAMNITTAKRTHWLEKPLQTLLLSLPLITLLGANTRGLAYVTVIGACFLYFTHLDLRLSLGPLTPLLVGPQYHRAHHRRDASLPGVNYAQIFPLFDMLGGTYHRPAADEFPETGVEGCDAPAERWRPLLW